MAAAWVVGGDFDHGLNIWIFGLRPDFVLLPAHNSDKDKRKNQEKKKKKAGGTSRPGGKGKAAGHFLCMKKCRRGT